MNKGPVPVSPVCRYVQVFGDQITQELGVTLVLLPPDFADAVEAAERAGVGGASEGHHLIRYDVHSDVLW